MVVLLSVILLAGVLYVWVSFKRTQTGYGLTQLKREITQLEEYHRKLKLEVAYLKSPEYLENKAVKELGLKRPVPEQIVFLP